MNMTLGKRLTLGFAVVLILTIAACAVSIIAMLQLRSSFEEMAGRTSDAAVAAKVPYLTVQKYQNQADLIINRDLSMEEEFNETSTEMDGYLDQLKDMVDTPEEEKKLKEIGEWDVQFNDLLHNSVVPEISHQLNEVIKKYDGEADVFLAEADDAITKLVASIQAELDEAIEKSDDKLLKARIGQLVAVKNLQYWMIKQYQNQADLIINQDISIKDDFAASAAMVEKYIAEAEGAVDTAEERALIAQIKEADGKFDEVFHQKVSPEVERILENRIGTYDAASDVLIGNIQASSDRIAESFAEEAK